jgi:hypothetical protein
MGFETMNFISNAPDIVLTMAIFGMILFFIIKIVNHICRFKDNKAVKITRGFQKSMEYGMLLKFI